MASTLKTVFLVPAAVALAFGATQGAPQQNKETPKTAKTIMLNVKKVHGQISFEIDSKIVKPSLHALGELYERGGRDCTLVVVLPLTVTFREANDVEMMADKVGFKTIRSFSYNPDTGFMAEIKWGRSIPYTTSPPPE